MRDLHAVWAFQSPAWEGAALQILISHGMFSMKKLQDTSQPRPFASEADFAAEGEASSCYSRDSKRLKGGSHRRKPKDMNSKEILECRPELKAAAFFVAIHLVQNLSSTINYVNAVGTTSAALVSRWTVTWTGSTGNQDIF
jgi:hypothetical protein